MKLAARLQSLFLQEMPFFLASAAFVWQGLLFYAPLMLIVFLSISSTGDNQSWCHCFTLDHYRALFNPMYCAIIVRSLVIATCNALLCICCAYPVAYYVAFYVDRFKSQFLFFLILPFWISFLVQIYAWFFVLEKHGLINSLLCKIGVISEPLHLLNTPFAVFLVMTYCYIPFAVIPIYSILEKFDKRLLEASSDLGATPWQTFIRVTLPLSAAGVRTGFFLVLVPSFGEFVIPTLLSGGKQLYVGSLISQDFLLARNVTIGSSFTCLSGIILILSCAFWYLFFRWLFGMSRRMIV